MNSQDHRQFLGGWNVMLDNKKKRIDVYEFRYLWQLRVGIELVDRQKKNVGIFAVLSTNAPEVTLEPGEFIIKTYSENRDLWKQMKEFPEFQDTGKFAVLPSIKCPIWRLRSHDICLQEKPKAENELYFTGVIERMFIILKENRPKRKYKDVISVSRFIDVLQHYCQALCESDFFSKEAQSLKHKDKRLVKYGRGKWKIVCGEMKK